MTSKPEVGQHVAFTSTLPHGTQRKLGNVTEGTVNQVTWNGRIAVQPTGSTGVVWVDAIDIEVMS